MAAVSMGVAAVIRLHPRSARVLTAIWALGAVSVPGAPNVWMRMSVCVWALMRRVYQIRGAVQPVTVGWRRSGVI
jgi:hypothetical protein